MQISSTFSRKDMQSCTLLRNSLESSKSTLAVGSLPISSLFLYLNFQQMCFVTYGGFLLFPLIPLERFTSVQCLYCCCYHKLFHVKRIKRLFPLPLKVKLTEHNSHHSLTVISVISVLSVKALMNSDTQFIKIRK